MLISKDKMKASITLIRPFCQPNGECIRIRRKCSLYHRRNGLMKTGTMLMSMELVVGFPTGNFHTKHL